MNPCDDFYSQTISDYPILGVDKERISGLENTGLKSPDWVNKGPLYEIYIRAFSPKGNIFGVIEKIPYLKELGVQTIWLMPIFPIGKKERKGSLGSPYSIRDYFNINPMYGTKDDVRQLVYLVHEAGMHIILDLVANHVSNDYVLMGQDDRLFRKDVSGKYTRKITDWTDVTDLDYDQPITRRYMTEVAKFWIDEMGFDGFRCDVAGLVPADFWRTITVKLKQIKPDVFMLAEWESPRMHMDAFNSNYYWILYFILRDVVQGKRPASDALKWVQAKQDVYPDHALPLRFLENHDMPRAADWFGRDGVKAFAAFIFSLAGLPLLYAGQEWGEMTTPSLFEKSTIGRNQPDPSLLNYYRHLIALRKVYPALASRELIPVTNNQPDSLISIMKKDQQQTLYCLINLSEREMLVSMDDARLFACEMATNLINGEVIEIKEGIIRFKPFQAVYIDGEKL